MASPATIPLEVLLTPVSGTAAAGTNLRLDASPTSVYFRLKDARTGARAAERRAETEGETPGLLSEWQTIHQIATQALAERSKDLEVAAWLTEALVRAHGFVGVRDGFKLMRGLVETYWETFWSLEDEEGLVTRLAPISGLNGVGTNGTLIQPLRKVPVTDSGDGTRFAAFHYDQAWALGQVENPELRARREAAGEVTMERFNASVRASGGPFYITLLADIQEALDEIEALDAALEVRAGRQAPSVSDIKNVLGTIRDTVKDFSKELVARTLAAEAGSAQVEESGAGGGQMEPIGVAGVRGREDALQILMKVADYFRTMEPHSPIAATLDELVRRARMPFQELLAELLPDPSAWRSALTSAGIKPPA